MVLFPGVSSEHSFMGLEARRRRDLPRRAKARLYRAKLPRARLLHHDGQPLRYAKLQNGQILFNTNSVIILNLFGVCSRSALNNF